MATLLSLLEGLWKCFPRTFAPYHIQEASLLVEDLAEVTGLERGGKGLVFYLPCGEEKQSTRKKHLISLQPQSAFSALTF